MARLRRCTATSKPTSPSHAARVPEEPPAGAKAQPPPPPPLLLPCPEPLLPPSLQTPCTHTPPGHGLPLGFSGFEHPVAGSHVPASWHSSLAVHTTGGPHTHTPSWHVS